MLKPSYKDFFAPLCISCIFGSRAPVHAPSFISHFGSMKESGAEGPKFCWRGNFTRGWGARDSESAACVMLYRGHVLYYSYSEYRIQCLPDNMTFAYYGSFLVTEKDLLICTENHRLIWHFCPSLRVSQYPRGPVQPADIGWPTGNGKKLISSQAQMGQATCLAVA